MASDVWKAFYNQGEESKTIQHIRNVMNQFNVDAYKAMQALEVPSEEYDYYLSRAE